MLPDLPGLLGLIKDVATAVGAVAGTVGAVLGIRNRAKPSVVKTSSVPSPTRSPHLSLAPALASAPARQRTCVPAHMLPTSTHTPIPRWLSQTTTLVITSLLLAMLTTIVPLENTTTWIRTEKAVPLASAQPVFEAPHVVQIDNATLHCGSGDSRYIPLDVAGRLMSSVQPRDNQAIFILITDSAFDPPAKNARWWSAGLAQIGADGFWSLRSTVMPKHRLQLNTHMLRLIAVLADYDLRPADTFSLDDLRVYGRSDIIRLQLATSNSHKLVPSDVSCVASSAVSLSGTNHRLTTKDHILNVGTLLHNLNNGCRPDQTTRVLRPASIERFGLPHRDRGTSTSNGLTALTS
jgi:hypothetical protein